MKQSLRSLLLVAALTAPSFAGTGVIGVASAIGSFSLNNTPVTGTANVSDGASLVTTSATSQVYLQNGSTVSVGINSSAKVYTDKVVLQSGVARVDNLGGSFDLMANGYRIEGSGKGTQFVARVSGDELQIASIAGPFNVYNNSGVLLRTVGAGGGAAFDGQSGASDQDSNNKVDCTKHPKAKGCPGHAASGAGGGKTLTDAEALLIAGALIGLGAGLGAYFGSKSTNIISPI